MNFNPKKFIQLMAIMPMFSLGQIQIKDQFDNAATWSIFRGVPKVIVMQGGASHKADKTQGQRWGVLLQNKFNGGFVPPTNTVQTLALQETIKILAVAALPSAAKWVFPMLKNSFRKDSPNFGILLDLGPVLSSPLGYDEKSKLPGIAIIPADHADGSQPATFELIMGSVDDQDVRNQVVEAIQKSLVTPK